MRRRMYCLLGTLSEHSLDGTVRERLFVLPSAATLLQCSAFSLLRTMSIPYIQRWLRERSSISSSLPLILRVI
jgi:hypothetical protein